MENEWKVVACEEEMIEGIRVRRKVRRTASHLVSKAWSNGLWAEWTRDHTREDLWGETEKEPYKQIEGIPWKG